jgi:hypothetical protein
MRIWASSPTAVEHRRRTPARALRRGSLVLALGALLTGCASPRRAPAVAAGSGDAGLPAALVAEARPIGLGPQFHPGVSGPVIGRCDPNLGRRIGVHVELFARNQVMLIARGIGTRRWSPSTRPE